VIDGKVRFVLPTGIGSVVIRDDVDAATIRQVLTTLS
jgi:3-dehydroquinate synthase